jgi:glycosyltransferase involved in cell wall biosynthesis
MHQYTADLANRQRLAGAEVHLVTTRRAPLDRYAPGITLHTPTQTGDSGFSPDAFRPQDLGRLQSVVRKLQPNLVHITGPHLWNPLLLSGLRRAGIPTVHTLHDLHPHTGAPYGRLLYLWNGWIQRGTSHLLVHGRCHERELVRQGLDPSRLTCTPLTHLFVGHAEALRLETAPPKVRYEPWILFLGRIEAYKGLDLLIKAARRVDPEQVRVTIAGPGNLEGLVQREIPANVEVRNHLIGDDEAMDLFSRCGLLVLPYIEASQSALVAAAYCFCKPVIVTNVGALPEYVQDDRSQTATGWITAPGNAQALARLMQNAIEDPGRLARMGLAGRSWYERNRRTEGSVLRQMYAALAGRTLGIRCACPEKMVAQ